MLRLIESHSEFLTMYEEITEFRKNPEEVIGMFSEALKIMDRNTTKYMIDEMHEELEESKRINAEKDQIIKKLEERIRELEEKDEGRLLI